MTGIIGALTPTLASQRSLNRLFRRRRSLLFLTGLIAVAAIACGGGGGDTSSSAGASAPTPSVRVMSADEGRLGEMGSG